ncbi:hypothetical protein AB0E56_11915 [Microbacterium sp. NPDC028030]|uniref:hypothetical protein n=1 Tax=Microbacterium sp. NPDC028030 TaxID=3155124 RepID=UPI00340888B9
MVQDPLDDRLDASALTHTAIDAALVRSMMNDARAIVNPRRTPRRAAVLSGAVALLLLGGAGVATASSDWLWGAGLENPDRSYTYTSPTWGQCEIRYSGWNTHNPLIQAEVDRIIDDWFATVDVEAAAEPYVATYLAQIEADLRAQQEEASDPRSPDLNAWLAHDQALATVLSDELKAHGIDSGRGDLEGTESHSQLHCEGEDWGGEGGTP